MLRTPSFRPDRGGCSVHAFHRVRANEANRAERSQSRRTNPAAPNEPIARVARTACLSGRRSRKRHRPGRGRTVGSRFPTGLLSLRDPDRQAVRATRRSRAAPNEAIGAERSRSRRTKPASATDHANEPRTHRTERRSIAPTERRLAADPYAQRPNKPIAPNEADRAERTQSPRTSPSRRTNPMAVWIVREESAVPLVPTLRVGMPSATLGVVPPGRRAATQAFRRGASERGEFAPNEPSAPNEPTAPNAAEAGTLPCC